MTLVTATSMIRKLLSFKKKNIATVSRNETVEFIDKSKYIGLTCDGTSDFIGEEYMNISIAHNACVKPLSNFVIRSQMLINFSFLILHIRCTIRAETYYCVPYLSFRTYTVICKLNKMKGHDIGDSYLNDKKAAEFYRFFSRGSFCIFLALAFRALV
jgi:hypothetical protein